IVQIDIEPVYTYRLIFRSGHDIKTLHNLSRLFRVASTSSWNLKPSFGEKYISDETGDDSAVSLSTDVTLCVTPFFIRYKITAIKTSETPPRAIRAGKENLDDLEYRRKTRCY
nr:hypothetical protein [Tanacetum cinerariifolium]